MGVLCTLVEPLHILHVYVILCSTVNTLLECCQPTLSVGHENQPIVLVWGMEHDQQLKLLTPYLRSLTEQVDMKWSASCSEVKLSPYTLRVPVDMKGADIGCQCKMAPVAHPNCCHPAIGQTGPLSSSNLHLQNAIIIMVQLHVKTWATLDKNCFGNAFTVKYW